MQVKPFFKSHKILEQYPILKDDTGNEFCLTLFEVTLPDDNNKVMESSYKFWTVVGNRLTEYFNKSTGYYDVAFYKAKEKKLFKGEINGFLVEEHNNGVHYVFGEYSLRTIFTIKRI